MMSDDLRNIVVLSMTDISTTQHQPQTELCVFGYDMRSCCPAMILTEVHVGKDQEKAQSERDSHSKSRGGKKPN